MPTALTTLQRVKRYLKQDVAYTDDDALLTDLLNAVSEEFRQFASQDFDMAQYTETYPGSGNRYLLLSQAPIRSVLSCSVAGSPLTGDGSFTGYALTAGALFRNAGWPCGAANVQVVYVAGYEDVPEDIQQACVQVVALRYKLKESEGLQSRGKGEAVDTFDRKDIPQYAIDALSKYIDPGLSLPMSSVKVSPPP